MGKTLSLIIFFVSTGTLIVLIAAAPWTLSDQNTFLRAFVGADLLTFIGVVVTISIATASNLYIELNKLEEREGVEIFPQSKKDVRDSVYALLASLFVAIAIVVIKPLANCGEHYQAFFNGAAILLILFQGITMADLIGAAFAFNPIERRRALQADEESAPPPAPPAPLAPPSPPPPPPAE